MYFKLSTSQEVFLLRQPETGMGYQIVEANRQGSYITEKFVVLNSEIVIELNKFESDNIRNVINEGISVAKSHASLMVNGDWSH